ncbi:hypothetical protein J7E62_08350 [Variovorax paradoxus]|nr:hypothetical protein [Variovorax paradoxus]
MEKVSEKSADTPRVSIHMLHQLASQALPANIVGGEQVDSIRVLVLAGLVQAAVSTPKRRFDGFDEPTATVTAITYMGRSMLKRFPAD